LTASSDLYSLGVVMFEMLAGRPPFVGPTAVSIAMQHASAPPPSLRQFSPLVPPVLEQLVSRTLQKEPEDRFTSALEMQQALRACSKELARSKQQTSQSAQAYSARYSISNDGSGSHYPPSGRGQY
jgi:serine/threonine-protein kinase